MLNVINDTYRGVAISLLPSSYGCNKWDFRIVTEKSRWSSGPYPSMLEAWLSAEDEVDEWKHDNAPPDIVGW